MSSTSLDPVAGVACCGLSAHVEELDRLGPEGRISSYRKGRLSAHQLAAWATRYPDEVPIVNGEFEWIGITLADLD